VDVVLWRGVPHLCFEYCTPPAAAPLARLLAGGAVKQLVWKSTTTIGADGRLTRAANTPFLDAAGAVLVADALRASTTLTSLELTSANLCRDMDAAATVLGTLAGHPSLTVLRMFADHAGDQAASGALLAAIVSADSPALEVLLLGVNKLGDKGLAPLVDALPLNRHIHYLDLRGNGLSDDFARLRLMPALNANTGLCALQCTDQRVEPSAAGAEKIINMRNCQAGHYGGELIFHFMFRSLEFSCFTRHKNKCSKFSLGM
jgi:hypothetical protein